jgi:hypothetical protein
MMKTMASRNEELRIMKYEDHGYIPACGDSPPGQGWLRNALPTSDERLIPNG